MAGPVPDDRPVLPFQDAKRPETGVRRIDKLVAMLGEGTKPYP